MKKAILNKLTPEQQAELDALAKLPDEQIDTADIPEIQIGVRPNATSFTTLCSRSPSASMPM